MDLGHKKVVPIGDLLLIFQSRCDVRNPSVMTNSQRQQALTRNEKNILIFMVQIFNRFKADCCCSFVGGQSQAVDMMCLFLTRWTTKWSCCRTAGVNCSSLTMFSGRWCMPRRAPSYWSLASRWVGWNHTSSCLHPFLHPAPQGT